MATVPEAPPIVRFPVDSTNLKAIGYDQETRLLHVEFRPTAKKGEPMPARGKVIQYHGVPPELYETFSSAPSKGKFFHAAIRGKWDGVEVSVPAMGACSKCGDIGLTGARCDDCGCKNYSDEREPGQEG